MPFFEPVTQVFLSPPRHGVRAPGWLNLIGEHTDYNDGCALPRAINLPQRAEVLHG